MTPGTTVSAESCHREPASRLVRVVTYAVGRVAGALTSLTGATIYRARGWSAPLVLRLVLGGLTVAATATAIAASVSQRSRASAPG
jgi:hypothetical protein